jgi:hypothetical protein
MRKNIILIVLLLILVVLTYNYISARYRIDYLSRQIDDHSISTKSRITLYESEDKLFYHLVSNDNQYIILTNVNTGKPDVLVWREEWVNGVKTIYTLFPDGTTEFNTEHKGYIPRLETWWE